MNYRKSILIVYILLISIVHSFSQIVEHKQIHSLGFHFGEGSGISYSFFPNSKSDFELVLEKLGLFNSSIYSKLLPDKNENSSFYSTSLNYKRSFLNNSQNNFVFKVGIGLEGRLYTMITKYMNYPSLPPDSIILDDPQRGPIYTFGVVPSIDISYKLSGKIQLHSNVGAYLDLYNSKFWTAFKASVGIRYEF